MLTKKNSAHTGGVKSRAVVQALLTSVTHKNISCTTLTKQIDGTFTALVHYRTSHAHILLAPEQADPLPHGNRRVIISPLGRSNMFPSHMLNTPLYRAGFSYEQFDDLFQKECAPNSPSDEIEHLDHKKDAHAPLDIHGPAQGTPNNTIGPKSLAQQNTGYTKPDDAHPITVALQKNSWEPYLQWGNPHMQGIYFLTEMVRNRMPGVHISIKDMFSLDHADKECFNTSQQPLRAHHLTILSLPKNKTEGQGSLDRATRDQSPPENIEQSVLFDMDVIKGSTAQLENSIQRFDHEHKNKTLRINYSCTPRMIGVDIESLVNRMNRKGRNTYICYTEDLGAPAALYKKYMKKSLRPPKKRSSRSRRRTVNIVGITKGPCIDELKEILLHNGSDINALLLPEFDEKTASHYHNAALQVVVRNCTNADIIDDLFQPLPMPTLTADAPYGFEACTRLYRSVLSTLYPEKKIQVPSSIHTLKKEWTTLISQAKNYTIGLVINPQDVPVLSEPEQYINSIPLLPLLCEMGFSLNILLYCDKDLEKELTEMLEKLLRGSPHMITPYENEQAYRSFMQRVDLVYSDLSLDPRVLAQGLHSFNSSIFEPGFLGAIHTLQALIHRCQNKLPMAYHAYLPNPAAPL